MNKKAKALGGGGAQFQGKHVTFVTMSSLMVCCTSCAAKGSQSFNLSYSIHVRTWCHSGRIVKTVHRQTRWSDFCEHTTSYGHDELSRTSPILTLSPCPHSSLSLPLRSFSFLRRPTPPGLVTTFERPYGLSVSD